MSKQDTHFFNMFSLVLGILITIAILLFALARCVGSSQEEHLRIDSLQSKAVDARTAPVAKVAVAGQNNSALEIKAPAAKGPAAVLPADGDGVYHVACVACHGAGLAGAPKYGDKGAWAPRIAKGMDTLHKHALEGFQGTSGLMPPKGGRTDFPDELIKAGVDYMVNGSR